MLHDEYTYVGGLDLKMKDAVTPVAALLDAESLQRRPGKVTNPSAPALTRRRTL